MVILVIPLGLLEAAVRGVVSHNASASAILKSYPFERHCFDWLFEFSFRQLTIKPEQLFVKRTGHQSPRSRKKSGGKLVVHANVACSSACCLTHKIHFLPVCHSQQIEKIMPRFFRDIPVYLLVSIILSVCAHKTKKKNCPHISFLLFSSTKQNESSHSYHNPFPTPLVRVLIPSRCLPPTRHRLVTILVTRAFQHPRSSQSSISVPPSHRGESSRSRICQVIFERGSCRGRSCPWRTYWTSLCTSWMAIFIKTRVAIISLYRRPHRPAGMTNIVSLQQEAALGSNGA